MVVTAAEAHRLQAIDAVYIDYKDMEGLRRQSEEGAGWGFTGKQVIHPGQVRRGHHVTHFILYSVLLFSGGHSAVSLHTKFGEEGVGGATDGGVPRPPD